MRVTNAFYPSKDFVNKSLEIPLPKKDPTYCETCDGTRSIGAKSTQTILGEMETHKICPDCIDK